MSGRRSRLAAAETEESARGNPAVILTAAYATNDHFCRAAECGGFYGGFALVTVVFAKESREISVLSLRRGCPNLLQ